MIVAPDELVDDGVDVRCQILLVIVGPDDGLAGHLDEVGGHGRPGGFANGSERHHDQKIRFEIACANSARNGSDVSVSCWKAVEKSPAALPCKR